jgi:hypothetical protein
VVCLAGSTCPVEVVRSPGCMGRADRPSHDFDRRDLVHRGLEVDRSTRWAGWDIVHTDLAPEDMFRLDLLGWVQAMRCCWVGSMDRRRCGLEEDILVAAHLCQEAARLVPYIGCCRPFVDVEWGSRWWCWYALCVRETNGGDVQSRDYLRKDGQREMSTIDGFLRVRCDCVCGGEK